MRRTAWGIALAAAVAMTASLLPVSANARVGELVQSVERLMKVLARSDKRIVAEKLGGAEIAQAIEDILKVLEVPSDVRSGRLSGHPFTWGELSSLPPEALLKIEADMQEAALRDSLFKSPIGVINAMEIRVVAPEVYFARDLKSTHLVASEPEQLLAILEAIQRAKSARDPLSVFANCSLTACLGSSSASVSVSCGNVEFLVSTKGHAAFNIDSGTQTLSIQIEE